MDPIIERFESVVPRLLQAETNEDIVKVCHTIVQVSKSHISTFLKHLREETYFQLSPSGNKVVLLLIKHFKQTKDLETQKLIVKAMLIPGLCLNYFHMELLFDEYSKTHGKLAAECLRDYAWFQNYVFITKYDVMLPNTVRYLLPFEELASMSYSKETRFFALAVENMVTLFEHRVLHKYSPKAFKIVLKNLDNPHQNVRVLLLELFKQLVKCFVLPPLFPEHEEANRKLRKIAPENHEEEMVDEILKLSWTNRNKFALLSHVINLKPELVFKHQKFNLTAFIHGVFVGLTLHHLYALSQALVKVIHNKEPFREALMKTIVENLTENEDDTVVENLVKFWFSTFETTFRNSLKEKILQNRDFFNIPTTSPKFYRVSLLRNAFKTKLMNDFDDRVKEFSCKINDNRTKIQVFIMLFGNIHTEPQLENILAFLAFLRQHIATDDSTFVDHHVMRTLPDFFNVLATKKFRNIEIQRELFQIINHDIYLHGIDLGSYESVMFSLKFLHVMLKQYQSGGKFQPKKGTDKNENEAFGKFLRDNKIWDFSSTTIIKHLVKFVDEKENSDLSDLAVKILVEFFIQKSIKVIDEETLDYKLQDKMSSPDLSTAREALKFFILKFEHSVKKGVELDEMLLLVEKLKSQFMQLNSTDDIARSMQEGKHLFNIIECVNYGLKRMNPHEMEAKLAPALKIILKLIVNVFLDFLHDPLELMSFEVVDQMLMNLTGDQSLKSKLLLNIFYTLRASSEVSETLSTIVCQNRQEFLHFVSDCIDINVQMLTRSCHKGVIEKASEALGKITSIVSRGFSSQCNKAGQNGRKFHALLVMLKKEIDCGKRPSGDIRSFRGLILMAHQIISNHPPFLRFLMENLLATNKMNSTDQFTENIKPIQLHLLAALVKDGALVEEMLKYLQHILLATLKAYKESSDFVLLNALLQVISAIVPKISNQKRQNIDIEGESLVNYEPKSVSAHELCLKFPCVFQVALADLRETSSLPNAYVIILLEVLSNFEHRGENLKDVDELKKTFEKLTEHRCDKIRILAGRCYALYSEINESMIESIEEKSLQLFSPDPNIVHSHAIMLRFMIQRYESYTKFVNDFDVGDFQNLLRIKISINFKQQKFNVPNFFVRYHLLEFLFFIQFPKDHEIVQSLLLETNLKNHFGYKLWSEKVKAL